MSIKLIEQMTESINFKLKDIERYTNFIDLVSRYDIKGLRKFIHDNDTHEKEMFYEYLSYGDAELFHRVYPQAHTQKGDYVVGIIHNQYKDDLKAERLHGLDWDDYPEDYCDAEYPDSDDPGYDRKEFDFEG
jgi:hypothetical protein